MSFLKIWLKQLKREIFKYAYHIGADCHEKAGFFAHDIPRLSLFERTIDRKVDRFPYRNLAVVSQISEAFLRQPGRATLQPALKAWELDALIFIAYRRGVLMVIRKFCGKNRLLDVLFPYIESEIKKFEDHIQSFDFMDYNRVTPSPYSQSAPHEESESS